MVPSSPILKEGRELDGAKESVDEKDQGDYSRFNATSVGMMPIVLGGRTFPISVDTSLWQRMTVPTNCQLQLQLQLQLQFVQRPCALLLGRNHAPVAARESHPTGGATRPLPTPVEKMWYGEVQHPRGFFI